MSQSVTDTIVEFDILHNDNEFLEMMKWLEVLVHEVWWLEKSTNGRIVGISFRHKEDAIAFRLKFGV